MATSGEREGASEQSAAGKKAEKTEVGNYFVANYPPFSTWSTEQVPAFVNRLGQEPAAGTPLGLYVHIPFCRKRCDFCYFKVYTDKSSKEIRRYLDAVIAELDTYVDQPAFKGRKPTFVYFGGGTPSYLSSSQLEYLFSEIQKRISFEDAREIAFEAEPGTLQESKMVVLRDLGVTRLSIGVENFDPEILELNNRAHRGQEIYKAYEAARRTGFPQINLDLIAGMVGETDANWSDCVRQTIDMAPDSVTIYQMEVPFNTTIYRRMKEDGKEVAPVADWNTKRRWTREAFDEMGRAGYHVSSAYTLARGSEASFLYRDLLWHGADLLGLGVSSFSQLQGVHMQNEHSYTPYVSRVEAGERPVCRAHEMTAEEQLVRQFILQMKLGELDTDYFQRTFGVDVWARFAEPLARNAHWISRDGSTLRVSQDGLLQIDRILHDFFLEQHRSVRYA